MRMIVKAFPLLGAQLAMLTVKVRKLSRPGHVARVTQYYIPGNQGNTYLLYMNGPGMYVGRFGRFIGRLLANE